MTSNMERVSYVREMNAIKKLLKEIPEEEIINCVSLESRLQKVQEEYRKKYPYVHESDPESIRKVLRDIIPTWVSIED